MKLRIDARTSYYPDVMVVCDDSPDDRYETSPCLVIEILSPSTASSDRREKRLAYLRIPAVLAHILLDPEAPRAEVHLRQTDGEWVASALSDNDELEFPCAELSVRLSDLYVNL